MLKGKIFEFWNEFHVFVTYVICTISQFFYMLKIRNKYFEASSFKPALQRGTAKRFRRICLKNFIGMNISWKFQLNLLSGLGFLAFTRKVTYGLTSFLTQKIFIYTVISYRFHQFGLLSISSDNVVSIKDSATCLFVHQSNFIL